MRKKKRGGGKQERDLITVGSKGIKTEMRETCVIAPLSWINTNREGCSVCHIVQLRCELYCDLLCNVCHTMNKPPEKWSKQLLLFCHKPHRGLLIIGVCTLMGLYLSIVLL